MPLPDIADRTVRFGAVFINRKFYGTVFLKSGNLRCGSVRSSGIVNSTLLRFDAGFTNNKSYGAVRCGPPLSIFLYGAVQPLARETVQHSFFLYGALYG